MTLSQTVEIADSDIIRLIEEFLANRQLDIALMCLERESGIINGVYSEDGLFLRQLILDGHWDDVLEFLLPLEGVEGYDKRRCLYLVYKHKFLELLCIKLDPGPLQNHDFTVEQVIDCLTQLEKLCTDRTEYDNLCFLLTQPSLSSDQTYKNWNPSSARINCFNELYPLVRKFVGLEKRPPPNSSSKQDRLVNLLAKGLLYELCVELCTARACGTSDDVTVNHLLSGNPCSDADLSLVSWLQKVPSGTLAIPFEKKSLKIKTDRLDKPALEAIWSEQLLAAPIKPKKFPHTSIPARTRSSQIMSQSMMAMYDGLSSNLFSPHGMRGSMSEPKGRHIPGSAHLSRSYAHAPTRQFLLTNSFSGDRRNNPLNQSMDQLFIKSARSSPRPLSSSPLVKEVKTEVISPGVADISPISLPSPTSHKTESQTLPDNLNSTPPADSHRHLDRQQTAGQSVNQSKSRDGGHSHLTSAAGAQPRVASSDNMQKQAVEAHRHVAPVVSSQEALAGTQQTPADTCHDTLSNQQRPDLLQHDVRESSKSSTAMDMTGSVRASQDLYAQYQQQKKRIEEEMRLMEQRDEKWRSIHSEVLPETEDIPKLNLDQSVNYDTAADSSQQVPYHDISDDIIHEVDMTGDAATIKQFVAVETLEEQGPVRAVAFHPTGECYAVGSNTKILRVCQYPDMSKITTSYHMATKKPQVLAKKVKHHSGSIYCAAWNTLGTVIASGSNDHTVKCVQWLSDQNVFGSEKSLSVHDGTVRDVSFLSTDQLLSAGAGDCTVCLTDVASGSVVRRYKGHEGHVLSLYPHRESQKFVSGGQDKKALMWDTRMSVPVQTYQSSGSEADSAFASVCLDPAPRVLASGHDNSYCTLYDLRQGRLLQAWRPHTDEVRSARFNADATYFLSGSYDTTVKLMDMQGDITQPLKTVQVAEHMDKVIQCRWHPLLPSFITSSADKTVTCWAIQIDD